MNKQIITILIIIFTITLVSAITIYAGESKTFPLDETPDKCEFSGNTYNLDGINFTINGNEVTVTIAPNFKPDNLTLKCFVGEESPVWYSFGSGGSSSSSTTTTEENKTEEVVETNKTDETTDEEIIDKRSDIKLIIALVILGIVIFVIVVYLIFNSRNK